jgi:hypothetical protein
MKCLKTMMAVAACALAIGNVQAQAVHRHQAQAELAQTRANSLAPFWSPDPELELSSDAATNLAAYANKPWGPVKYILIPLDWNVSGDDRFQAFRQHSLYDQGYVRLGALISSARLTVGEMDQTRTRPLPGRTISVPT